MAKAILVCCYGVYDERLRTHPEITGLEEYAEGIVGLVDEGHPEYVVLCGGFTNPASTRSEADTMLSLIAYLIDEWELDRGSTTFLIDDRGRTTTENIVYGLETLQQEAGLVDEVMVVCDRPRWLKVTAVCVRHVGFHVHWKVKSLRRRDIHPDSRWHRQLPKAIGAFFAPRQKLSIPREKLRS